MEWRDTGFVLGMTRHGEGDAVVQLLTRDHGRHLGLVKGGASKSRRADFIEGNLVDAVWTARLDTHLGRYTAEPAKAFGALCLSSPAAMTALASAAALSALALPEREPHPAAFDGFLGLAEALVALPERAAASVYVRWELGLLSELGFGLDLRSCAVTGETEGLAYVSPRTGRAVTTSGAGEYAARLLELPSFLTTGEEPGPEALAAGFRLTALFLERDVLGPHNVALPAARARYEALILR